MGEKGIVKIAMWAPRIRPLRLRLRVRVGMASIARKEKPPFRIGIVDDDEGEGVVGRELARARKVSLWKEENEVKDPQKPVDKPMYRGIVFLMLVCCFVDVA